MSSDVHGPDVAVPNGHFLPALVCIVWMSVEVIDHHPCCDQRIMSDLEQLRDVQVATMTDENTVAYDQSGCEIELVAETNV